MKWHLEIAIIVTCLTVIFGQFWMIYDTHRIMQHTTNVCGAR